MRGADDPALAILMARATASDKIIDRINRRRRRAQVEPAVGAHHEIRLLPIHYEITPVCPSNQASRRAKTSICFGVTMRTSYAHV